MASELDVEGTDSEEASVDTPCSAYTKMAENWSLINDLTGGTKAMRDAAEEWLPKEEKETDIAYQARLRRSYLYAALEDTIEKLSSKPFSRPVALDGDDGLSDTLSPIADNCDRTGRDLSQFSKDIFNCAVTYGLVHILVDYPNMPPAATRADEKLVDARPFFIMVSPLDLIGWDTETAPNGETVLTEIRIKECFTEKKGRWGEQEVHQVRVYGKSTWEIWQKRGEDDDEYTLVESGDHTFGSVPLVTIYTNRVDYMMAEPPLMDLAWMNLAHWQSMSDQRNILRFARVGMLFAAGFTDEEIERGVYVGPNQLVSSTNPNAKMSFVEHSGAAIKAGKDDLDDLEKKMEVLGLQPMIERTAKSTATGKIFDENRSSSDIQTWIRALEEGILSCYDLAAQWVGETLPEDLDVNIVDTFDLMNRSDTDVTNLIAMATAGKLTDRTLLVETKRRGLLADTLDVDQEVTDLEAQGPTLSSLTNKPAVIGKLPGQKAK